MRYPNTDQLKGWLLGLAAQDAFEVNDLEFREHLTEIEIAGTRPAREWLDAAAFRCLSSVKVEPKALPERLELSAILTKINEMQTHILSAQHHVYAGLSEKIQALEAKYEELLTSMYGPR